MFRTLFTLFVTAVVGFIFMASFSGCSGRQTTHETKSEVEDADSDLARWEPSREAPRQGGQ